MFRSYYNFNVQKLNPSDNYELFYYIKTLHIDHEQQHK